MRRYSKLKKRIENLFAPDLNMKVYCNVYPSYSSRWFMPNPRVWITLDKEIIFDFIKDFMKLQIPMHDGTYRTIFYEDVTDISHTIHEYIETPVNILFDHIFEKDCFGLTDILKAADRRIGKNRLLLLRERTQSEAAKKVIGNRLGAA